MPFGVLRVLVRKIVVGRQIQCAVALAENGASIKLTNSTKSNWGLIRAWIFAAFAGLWVTVASAQTNVIYVAPVFLYQFNYGPSFTSPSLEATFANAAAQVAALDNSTSTNVAENLHPADAARYAPFTYYDGTPALYSFDLYICYLQTGQCSTTQNWDNIYTLYTCPAGPYATYYNSPSNNQLLACAITLPPPPPPRCKSKSCLGNPIFASTGQKMQAETDYPGVDGLNFIRTYRSNNGYFASAVTQTFVNNSLPAGTLGAPCYPAYYTSRYYDGYYCFPYISVYPYVNNGVAQYMLQTVDGQSLAFSGPGAAVTAGADINDRVTQVTFNGAAAWQIHREDDSIEIYTTGGSLIQRTLRGGKTFTYTYSTSSTPTSVAPQPGLLLTESDAFGHTLSWTYNASGQMMTMTDSAGGTYQYSYTNGNLTGVIYPDQTSKTYWYNESANTGGANLPTALTGITDESGVRYATFQYNSANLAVNTQHAGGVDSYTFDYTSPGSSTTVTDPLGTTRTYQFETPLSYVLDNGQTQPAASGIGSVTQSETYDANGNTASLTDYNGNVTRYTQYDMTRNLEESRTEAYGTPQERTITTQWNPIWRQPALITEPNRTTSFTYDSLGNVYQKTITDLTVTPSVTRTWTYTYDTYGRIQTVLGPRGNGFIDKTSYTYYTCTTGYECGEVETITNNAGHVTTFNSYNAHGQPLKITDPNGVVTQLTYDARQRLLSRTVATDLTKYSYWPTGLLEQITLPDSSTVSFKYDPAHRLTDITDGVGNHIHYTLDNMGNRTGENTYDPGGTLHRLHTRMIDALNHLHQDINSAATAAVTTTYGYDNDDNQTSIAAPLARNTGDQYDALNRLTVITDPKSGVTQLGYDGNDNLSSVVDPRGLTTSYTHNGFDDLTKVVSPDTGTTTFTYDSGGNPKTATDARGAVTNYNFDNGNRLIHLNYTDQVIYYTYDAGTYGKDRLTGASDTNHSMSWTYDALGHVTGKGQVIGTISRSVGYGYTNGDMVSLVTPSGQTVTYGYTNHRITSIAVNGTTLLSAVTYDPFGPATGWTWGNSTASTRSFDLDGNPSQIVTAGVTNGYTVDYASRITGISDSGLSTDSFTFGYDALDRVTSGVSTGKVRGYMYDANGNRTSMSGTTGSTETISTTSNQLKATSGGYVRTYAYDAAGNTLSYASNTYTFNQRGRMSSAVVSGAETDYIYNALGQLIEKSGNGGTTLLVYDEAGHLLGEYTSAGALIQETVWMGDTPVATLRPSGSTVTIYYVHTDHLGNPRKVTRPSDNGLMWRWDPDTFGSAGPNVNPSGYGTFNYNLRFPGQYALTESALNYNYFRDYDPTMGRYVESDPIGLAGGSYSTYAYAGGNPISRIDPMGLMSSTAQQMFPQPATATSGQACPNSDDHCEEQAQKDEAICRTLSSPAVRARCWESANERYGACRAKRPIPPLVVWQVPGPVPNPVPVLPLPSPVPITPVVPPVVEPVIPPILEPIFIP
jgi:RHS repeat-associated protein